MLFATYPYKPFLPVSLVQTTHTMNPQNPGGRQQVGSFNPMGFLPQTPLTNAQPGAFPHTNIQGPGNRLPSSGVPATTVGPGSVPPASSTFVNSGSATSNELVSYNLTPKNWSHHQYEKKQRPGELLFGKRDFENNPQSILVATLAQYNECLRIGWDTIVTQLTNKPRTGIYLNNQEVTSVLQPIKTLFEEYQKKGEFALISNERDPDAKRKIQFDTQYQKLMYASLEHLVQAWNYLGLYVSDGGREYQKRINLNIGVRGPSNSQPVVNYWGDVKEKHRLFLILSRHYDRTRSSPGKPVYTHFEIRPWFGYGNWPPDKELFYEDDGGVHHRGVAFYVGQVIFTPLIKNSQSERDKMLGLNASADQAYDQVGENTSHIVVDLGPSRHELVMYGF